MPATLSRRQHEVAEAIAPVFLENGFNRTTMGDLAAAAGVTRQGLYLIFPHKEAAFTGAVTVLNGRLHATLREGLARLEGREARVAFVCERWISGIYDLQQARPQAKDMDDLAFPVVRDVYALFVDVVADLLREGREAALNPVAAEDLARVLVYGIRGVSANARDTADMRALVQAQVQAVLLAADARSAST